MKTKEIEINPYQLKLELFRFIDNLTVTNLIQFYDYFILKHADKPNDFWLQLTDIEKQDIELGIADLDNGKKSDFYEFMKNYQ